MAAFVTGIFGPHLICLNIRREFEGFEAIAICVCFPCPLMDGYKKYKRIQKNRMQDIIRYFGYFFLAKNTVFIWPLFEAQKQLHLYLNKNWGNFNNLLEWSISKLLALTSHYFFGNLQSPVVTQHTGVQIGENCQKIKPIAVSCLDCELFTRCTLRK